MNIDLTVSDIDALLFALLYAKNAIDVQLHDGATRADSELTVLRTRLNSLSAAYAKIDAIKGAST
jgi:hypothetical protein